MIEQAIAEGRKHLAENEVKELLKRAGISTTEFQFFHDPSELDYDRLTFPAVLKVCSPKIVHKSDVSGVILNIESREQFDRTLKDFQSRFPGEGFLAEPMYLGKVEVIVGVVNDSSFGLTLMFGVGGIYTEVYKDVTFRVMPINRRDAEEMLSEIKAAPILEGFRNVEIDRESVIELLMQVSEMADQLSKYMDQMDLNPVLVSADGVTVIDASMILK